MRQAMAVQISWSAMAEDRICCDRGSGRLWQMIRATATEDRICCDKGSGRPRQMIWSTATEGLDSHGRKPAERKEHMKEYGGYIELDTYHGKELYPDLLALNSARTALRFLIRYRQIKKILLPTPCCYTIWEACEQEKIPWAFYPVDQHFQPVLDDQRAQGLEAGEWLYLVNYYGVLSDDQLQAYADAYPRLIVDNAQAFFRPPFTPQRARGMERTVDTLYSCRKFLGVPDGAYLDVGGDAAIGADLAIGNAPAAEKDLAAGNALTSDPAPHQTMDQRLQSLYDALPLDVSHQRMGFLLGRFEGRASDYYADYASNNALFSEEPVKQMSRLTHNLLRGIDYDFVMARRSENFRHLHERLKDLNRLELPLVPGAYAYPFWYREDAPSGPWLRKKLLEKKIYIPTLWPEMLQKGQEETMSYRLSENILPLPVDQRYGMEDMDVICDALLAALA